MTYNVEISDGTSTIVICSTKVDWAIDNKLSAKPLPTMLDNRGDAGYEPEDQVLLIDMKAITELFTVNGHLSEGAFVLSGSGNETYSVAKDKWTKLRTFVLKGGITFKYEGTTYKGVLSKIKRTHTDETSSMTTIPDAAIVYDLILTFTVGKDKLANA